MKGHLHLPHPHNQRLQRIQAPTYERLQARLAEDHSEPTEKPLSIHCGWGRLLIGQTYPDAEELARDLLQEAPGERDIALYVAAPQQVLAHAPQQLFLDPSDTLRLWFTDYRPARRPPRGFRIRRVHTEEDWAAINRLYLARGMLPVQTERLSPRHQGGPIYWLAEDADTGVAVGTVMGLNHAKAFQDPEGGSSLWCLAVDPQCSRPGVGEALVRHLVEHFMSRELAYLDLSVLHNNQQAKALYRKLGFRELATFTIKRKNGINQSLFLGPGPEEDLNPYARIIVDEAHRRGIEVRVDDAEGGLFTLTQGGRQPPAYRLESSSMLANIELLRGSDMLSIGSARVVEHLAGLGLVARLALEIPGEGAVGMCWRDEPHRDRASEDLLACLREGAAAE
ncbi:GNAT family N-acetyltransferase [Pseudomonas aeruginosa]|nr:GNAT family N-acetyltransferase [Pseudomonas aeruginosa]MBF3250982.1 GNAT family N-acetyltransferase [Pseudomonas aeruginosa]